MTRETLQISSLKKMQYKHMKMCTRIIKNSIRRNHFLFMSQSRL